MNTKLNDLFFSYLIVLCFFGAFSNAANFSSIKNLKTFQKPIVTPIVTENNYFLAILENCNNLNYKKEFGTCINKTVCKCNPGFADFSTNQNINQTPKCSYVQKRNTIAFILELLTPIGLGHFYCENFIFLASSFCLL